jgi:hypothetical protein
MVADTKDLILRMISLPLRTAPFPVLDLGDKLPPVKSGKQPD